MGSCHFFEKIEEKDSEKIECIIHEDLFRERGGWLMTEMKMESLFCAV